MRRLVLLALLLIYIGCDHGLEPPDVAPLGAIQGSITYTQGRTNWPPDDSLRDLRFFALPFVPQNTLDLFRDLNVLVFSDRLNYRVDSQQVLLDSVEAKTYVYSGVAQQFSRNIFDWRPVGLAPIFEVRPGEVTQVEIEVDFSNLPPFPPPPGGNVGKGERARGGVGEQARVMKEYRLMNVRCRRNVECNGPNITFKTRHSAFVIRHSKSPPPPFPLSPALPTPPSLQWQVP